MAGQRGSVYVVVLGMAMLVTAIGLSSLLHARVTHRQVMRFHGMDQARVLAGSAIDVGLFLIEQDAAAWQQMLGDAEGQTVDLLTGTIVPGAGGASQESLGGGTYSILATFLDDGDPASGADEATLLGVGRSAGARFLLEVRVDAMGHVVAGTWRRRMGSGT
ncbi:MAG: hypothetical protein OER86_02800 [Phycisphaerae bacterium]|nr:hypothetical protein [Phycisphaerae bacterium]